ncbi:MAG TPA: MFS transporter [Acidimicrobiales bacterium]
MALTPVQKRDLRLLALFRGFSFLGDSITLITLYLRVAHHGHGWMIAALSIAAALPLVLLAPFAGYVVDRLPAKTFLALLCVFESLVCAGIGLWHGNVATIFLMALLTCGVAFSLPGYSALVPTLSGEENVAVAQSTVQSAQSIALTAGPALGGLLVGALGQSWPLYLDAASFALAGLGTLLLRTDRRPSTRAADEKSKKEMSAGVRLIFSDPYLRPVIVTVTVFMLSLGAVNVAEVFFITQTLHASDLMYGLVGTSFGAGSILGSLSGRVLKQEPLSLVKISLFAITFISVLLGAVGLMEHVVFIFPLMVVTGVAVGLVNVAFSTLFAVQTPEALRGRVFAATGALFTSAEISSMVLGGLLLTLVAPRTIFQMAGVFSILSVIIVGPLELRTSHRAHHSALSQGD